MRRRTAALLAVGLAGVALAALCTGPSPASIDAVRAGAPSSEGALFDRHGELLHELRVDARERRAAWVTLDDISPLLREAVIAVEDHRFRRHHGIDWLALVGIARRALGGHGRLRGGSTLTMQLAGLLDPAIGRGGQRGPVAKLRQLRAALALERHWRKEEILEAYLNLASFRGEVVGIGAASLALAGRAPDALDRVDALLLASLLGAPNAAATAVATRACRLAVRLPWPAACDALAARAAVLVTTAPRLVQRRALAPHVARSLLGSGRRVVRSTLDGRLQRVAREALAAQLAALAPRQVRDGAVLAIDNASGEVLVYLGNQGAGASAPFVDGVRARRLAGSTLKPFVYGLALETRVLTAASVLDDSPLHLETPRGLYVPRNYDGRHRGPVSVRSALAGSLNIPAVRALALVGPEAVLARLRGLGFAAFDEDADYYGFGLALGGAEVSLWELAEAYRSLVTAGTARVPAHLAGPPPATSVSPLAAADARAAAWLVGDILADRASRAASFGLDNALALPFWSAVKTGTSKHMRDNWCVGYSTRYTVAVWVGNFDGAPMGEVSGLSGAAPVWAAVMRALHETPPSAPGAPPGLEASAVAPPGTTEPRRREWFLAGTAPGSAVATLAPPRRARIAYPGPDAVLALDPDVPPALQRIFFVSRPAHPGERWLLDGRPYATGTPPAWRPRPGHHELALLDDAGRRVDALRFEVRGRE